MIVLPRLCLTTGVPDAGLSEFMSLLVTVAAEAFEVTVSPRVRRLLMMEDPSTSAGSLLISASEKAEG